MTADARARRETGPEDAAAYRLFKRCQAIRDRYADGVPLARGDRKIVLEALRRHPRGREKFGPGVNAVVVHRYIAGSRCFFVVRADGSVKDFSLRKCLGRQVGARTALVARLMLAFDYQAVLRRYRTLRGPK